MGFGNFLRFPNKNNPLFNSLCSEMDKEMDEIITYLHWFTGELLYEFGSEYALDFLSKNGSQRLSVEKMENIFVGRGKFINIVKKNCSLTGYIEIQSASGFWKAIRRYHAIKNLQYSGQTQKIAHSSGISIREVQRLKKLPRK